MHSSVHTRLGLAQFISSEHIELPAKLLDYFLRVTKATSINPKSAVLFFHTVEQCHGQYISVHRIWGLPKTVIGNPPGGGWILSINLCWFDDLTTWLDKRIKQSNTLVNFHVCPTHKCMTLLFLILSLIDWCCFYYSIRNSLVASLEALCAWIFSLDSWISGFSWHYFQSL